VATVEILCELDPASGSVMAKAMSMRPSASWGSHRSFCSSVPKRAMMLAQMAGDTTRSNRGHPAAASSSHTMARSEIPPPPPP
jgi:hypothetical protein